MTDSLVSIIVPCYNGESFIDRCFSSILAQSYKNIEIVAVNDGSTDGSEEKLLSYKKAFEAEGMHLNVVSQTNKGLGGAIDTGLKHITGAYLMLLDIDDLLLPQAIENCLDAFSDSVMLVRGDGYYVNENDIDTVIKKLSDLGEGMVKGSLFEALVYATAYNWAGSYMLKTEALFAFYPDKSIYPSRFGQNLQLLMPIAYKHKSTFIDCPLMKYVQRNESLSHVTGDANNYLGYMDIRLKLLDTIVENNTEREIYKKAVRTMYNRKLLEIYCLSGNLKEAKARLNLLKKDREITRNDKKLYYKYRLGRLLKK